MKTPTCTLLFLISTVGLAGLATAQTTTFTGDVNITGKLKTGTSTTTSTNLGINATSLGLDNQATGDYSLVGGIHSYATGVRSLAIGNYAFATGTSSVALGQAPQASGTYAVALGSGSAASGSSSLALASGYASGVNSIALGVSSVASGNQATAIGYSINAQAQGSFVIGRYNVVSGSTTTWYTSEPLFVIGNGNSTTPRNALTVLKDGNVGIGVTAPTAKLEVNGIAKVLPGGDLGMGSFTAGTPPQ